MSDIHSLSKIIKWTKGFFIFMWQNANVFWQLQNNNDQMNDQNQLKSKWVNKLITNSIEQ